MSSQITMYVVISCNLR